MMTKSVTTMDAITALTQRVSVARLQAPAPTDDQLETLFAAALRAPDHMMLRPWRFIVIREDRREALGELYAKAALTEQPDLSPDAIDRFKGLPLRAPMLVAIVCSVTEHPKVPEIEQVLSTGAAVHGLLTAAHAMKIGAMWRTGSIGYSLVVAEGLGLKESEKLLGFVYLGTPVGKAKPVPELFAQDFVSAF
ncbi:nitroreductase family protein [Spongorhabdus nitratireducens]